MVDYSEFEVRESTRTRECHIDASPMDCLNIEESLCSIHADHNESNDEAAEPADQISQNFRDLES